jgi:transcriptional regulator with XRE-family HTH domain
MNMTNGEKLRAARAMVGLNQAEIARRTQIDKRRLSQIELDKRDPTPEEVQRLAGLGLWDNKTYAARRPTRCYTSEWIQRPHAAKRHSSHPLSARIARARKTFGPMIERLLASLGQGKERAVRKDFLDNSCLDSAPELLFWLLLLAAGGRPRWLPPSRTGFRRLPILDPSTRQIISDARFPCLESELDGLSLLAFPQLTVLARGRQYRLDGLLGLKVNRQKVWINLEIDGLGHENRFDEERATNLGLPSIRLTSKELSSPDALRLLKERLTGLLGES